MFLLDDIIVDSAAVEEESLCVGVQVDEMCYYLLDTPGKVSYPQAVSECNTEGGQLAYIKNEQVYITLLGYLSHLTHDETEMYVWLGGKYDVSAYCPKQ